MTVPTKAHVAAPLESAPCATDQVEKALQAVTLSWKAQLQVQPVTVPQFLADLWSGHTHRVCVLKGASNSGDICSGESLKHIMRIRSASKGTTEHQDFTDIVMNDLDSVCASSWFRIIFASSDTKPCALSRPKAVYASGHFSIITNQFPFLLSLSFSISWEQSVFPMAL